MFQLELSEDEKQLLSETLWENISTLAILKDFKKTTSDENRELELYKNIYKKLGNELEDWVEEV